MAAASRVIWPAVERSHHFALSNRCKAKQIRATLPFGRSGLGARSKEDAAKLAA
jgi:hypothetical protein